MSNCTFQAQLVSIMEILAKAAVAEINRRVNDSCAVIRLEMRRSQRDIDALKRKYHVMENELRRTKGRPRKKVPLCVVSDRYTPTPRSVSIQNRACVWSEEHTTVIPEQRQPPLVQDTLVPHPSSDVAPLIKEETEEDNMWGREGDQVTFSHQGPDGAATAEEVSHTPLDGQHGPHTHTTHTGEQEAQVTVEVQVKFEEEEEGGGRKEEEEEDKKEERNDGEATEEQQQQQGLGQGEFSMEQHGGASLWTTSTSDFSTETYTHTQPLSVPPLPTPPPPPPLIGPTTMEQNSAMLMARNTGRARWGVQGDGQEPCGSRPQAGFRTGGGPALGLSGFRGNNGVGIGGFSNNATATVGYQTGALRRLRPHQWRSVGPTAGSSSTSSSSSLCAERRVYVCSFCPKSFARLSQLKEHLRSHTGEKPFSCATCGRRFTKHCNLVRHAVVHSGEKPYRCPTCAKCFTQSSSLKSHQRTHLMPHHREGALVSRAQFRGALLSGAGTSQSYRGFT
ncbi:zinc finger protein 316 [Alosa sapidissima]|uniref:zinc finger protein 316 n=1 Tax=Alosa sapidissima TaxID=34773 RepID=UPI001C08C847|nr:zinc finger protein 316 [Alosa sapidissima]